MGAEAVHCRRGDRHTVNEEESFASLDSFWSPPVSWRSSLGDSPTRDVVIPSSWGRWKPRSSSANTFLSRRFSVPSQSSRASGWSWSPRGDES